MRNLPDRPLVPGPTYGLVGAGGFGREIMPVLDDMLRHAPEAQDRRLVFVVEGEVPATTVNGYPVMPLDRFLDLDGPRFFNVAIADSRVRERIARTCLGAGVDAISIVSQSALILDGAVLGEGAIVAPFATVSANATVGRFVHVNFYSYVAHDCVVGDYVTFAPAVRCLGNVVVRDRAYIGAGAIIRQGSAADPRVVGEDAVVGMGAIVLESVAAGETVVGNPARVLRR
jgi:sugar O-acyltransferase (sialic acid O-acetyltransferase NeuD family)